MAEVARGIVDKAMTGVKDRVDDVRRLAKKEVEIVKTFIGDVAELKPVKAAVDLVSDSLENMGDTLKKQAEITRRWIAR